MASNQAAWLDAVGKPLRVGPAEMPQALEGEVVIRNRAVACNPVSWKIQDTGIIVKKMPTILDYDVAGKVYEVGPNIKDFQKGDRVVAFVGGPITQELRYGAFQLYSVAKAVLVAKLPESIPFTEACVLPVAFNTALVSLCAPLGQGFGLQLPSLDPKPSGKTIVVWGASSSTGTFMLQLARAAGVKAIAVASEHNHELCKSCSAVDALDYGKDSIVSDVVKAVKSAGGEFVGIIDCVSVQDQSIKFCIPILEQLGGGQLGLLLPEEHPKVPDNVKVTNIFGVNDITHAFWKDFITPALKQGKLKCTPASLVVGDGLESLQKALDVQRKGVSAKKVVVTL